MFLDGGPALVASPTTHNYIIIIDGCGGRTLWVPWRWWYWPCSGRKYLPKLASQKYPSLHHLSCTFPYTHGEGYVDCIAVGTPLFLTAGISQGCQHLLPLWFLCHWNIIMPLECPF